VGGAPWGPTDAAFTMQGTQHLTHCSDNQWTCLYCTLGVRCTLGCVRARWAFAFRVRLPVQLRPPTITRRLTEHVAISIRSPLCGHACAAASRAYRASLIRASIPCSRAPPVHPLLQGIPGQGPAIPCTRGPATCPTWPAPAAGDGQGTSGLACGRGWVGHRPPIP
jgi:hypothetical protein